ncbi:MAG: acetolactate synthase small subunit [Bacteroidota bacterium]
MTEEQTYTLSVFTENKIGLLHRITTIFTRRHINIESLTTSESEIQGIHRFVIVIKSTETQVLKLQKQLDKIIGVVKAFVLRDHDVVHQELAMYKVSTEKMVNGTFERIIRDNHARVLSFDKDHLMIEKTGHPGETLQLFKLLEPYGVLGFSRSGAIAISKKPLNLRAYVEGELKE